MCSPTTRRVPAQRALSVTAVLALALVAACGSSQPSGAVTEDAALIDAPAPWTDAFAAKATLIADVIEVEGPAGLRNHWVAVQDPETIDYDLSTTPQGLRQIYALKPGAGGRQLSAWLDNWNLFAFERIVVLERPTRGGAVVVRAVGSVVASLPEGETRSERFERSYQVGQ
jgi:hypothetical protein